MPTQADNGGEVDDKRSLYLLTDKLVSAIMGVSKIAEPHSEVNVDNYEHWAPNTHPIPRREPQFPFDLQGDISTAPDNALLESIFSSAVEKYTWDRQAWDTANKICESFQHHKYRHLFLEISPDWKTPSFPPVAPQLSGPLLQPHYSTVAELVSACQFYLWDLQRWEEEKDKQETDIDTIPSQSQEIVLPSMTGRKRESVVTVEDFQRRKAPRRASQRRESYFANAWIPSDQLDPPSNSGESETGDNQEVGDANGYEPDEDDEETIRLGSPAEETEQLPPSEQPRDTTLEDDLLGDEKLATSTPSDHIPLSTQRNSPEGCQVPGEATDAQSHAVADRLQNKTLTAIVHAVEGLTQAHMKSRLRDLKRKRNAIEKEAQRRKEDSELRIAHMKKFGYAVAEIEWEEAKLARDQARYREDVEDVLDVTNMEDQSFSSEHEGDA